ncbi:MAG: hypothetical protein FWD99_05695 [Oscillospiraceae bacterium]|nr:hypothetical protein [Oscillospiraceae bacterium]
MRRSGCNCYYIIQILYWNRCIACGCSIIAYLAKRVKPPSPNSAIVLERYGMISASGNSYYIIQVLHGHKRTRLGCGAIAYLAPLIASPSPNSAVIS